MLLVSLASDFLMSIENHNSEGKERKIDKGRRRREKAIGHYLKNSREGTQQRCHLFPIRQTDNFPLSGSHKTFHFSYMKFLCFLKFLFISLSLFNF